MTSQPLFLFQSHWKKTGFLGCMIFRLFLFHWRGKIFSNGYNPMCNSLTKPPLSPLMSQPVHLYVLVFSKFMSHIKNIVKFPTLSIRPVRPNFPLTFLVLTDHKSRLNLHARRYFNMATFLRVYLVQYLYRCPDNPRQNSLNETKSPNCYKLHLLKMSPKPPLPSNQWCTVFHLLQFWVNIERGN